MVSFNPIARVKTQDGRYFIEFDQELFAAVTGLEEFGHIQVIWHFHLCDSEQTRNCFVIDKPYKNGPEKTGVLATRGPVRPNPIAITVCGLIHIDHENNRIEVDYIDAEDGTPVLDIKPYHPSSDRIRDIKMPVWCSNCPAWYEESGEFDWSSVFNF